MRPNPRPPAAANWLLVTFAPPRRLEPVLGDLWEEFTTVHAARGLAAARRRFWFQALSAIAYTNAAALRADPLLAIVSVLAALWLLGRLTSLAAHTWQTTLDAHSLYISCPALYPVLLSLPLTFGRVILALLLGVFAALPSRQISTAVPLLFAACQLALFAIGTLSLIATGRPWIQWFCDMAPWNCACAVATLAGAALVQLRRHRQNDSRILA
jgi:hypothetical protein